MLFQLLTACAWPGADAAEHSGRLRRHSWRIDHAAGIHDDLLEHRGGLGEVLERVLIAVCV